MKCPKCKENVKVPKDVRQWQIWCCGSCGTSVILDNNKLELVVFEFEK